MKERGFTLVEVIVAMGLVGIIGVMFIPILSFQYKTIYSSGDKSQATYKAAEKLEREVENINKKDVPEKDKIEIKIKFDGDEITETVRTVKQEAEVKDKTTHLRIGIPIEK